jgi:hypothetical protein
VVVWVVEVAVVVPATGTVGVAVPLLRTKESIVRFAEMYGNFRVSFGECDAAHREHSPLVMSFPPWMRTRLRTRRRKSARL